MIIIKMKGGLGNQMFQYALYCTLQSLGREVKMDSVTGFRNDPQRDPALSVFGIACEEATPEEVVAMTDSYMDLWSRVRRKLFGRRTFAYDEPADGNFDPHVLELTKGYLEGFWQSERYFSDPRVQERLRREFTLRTEGMLRDDTDRSMLRRIETTESVSVHVRRGDYLEPGTIETFGGICTEEYYRQAVERMLDMHPEAVFYVFSNDQEWTAKHLRGESIVQIATDDGKAESDLTDFYLMRHCRHHILANSSFSWWAAWLANARDKTIIAPRKWLNNKDLRDIYTENMIKI